MKLGALLAAVAAVVALGVVGVVWATGGLDRPSEEATAPEAAGGDTFPEGVFRYRLTRQEVLKLVPAIEPRLLEDAIGTFTWTFRDGTISLHQTDCRCSFTDVSAPFTATQRLFTVRWPEKAANGVEFCASGCQETVAWRFDGRALYFTPMATAGYDLLFWGAHKPWVKIG